MPRRTARTTPVPTPPAAQLLDDVLPFLTPAVREVHLKAALLEVSEPSQLLELVADKAVRPFLLGRLSPTVALVDMAKAQPLLDTLRRRGHTPKVIEEGATP